MELFDYLSIKTNIGKQYYENIKKVFRKETYKKGTILLKPGHMSQKVIFIESGLLRLYYQQDDKIITFLFLDENTIMVPLESAVFHNKNPYGWEVIQDCTLNITQFDNIQMLMDTVPLFERYILNESLNAIRLIGNKIYDIQMLTAEERYNNLLEKQPFILQNAPLGHIASYLGISQQHLSVIRAKRSKSLCKMH